MKNTSSFKEKITAILCLLLLTTGLLWLFTTICGFMGVKTWKTLIGFIPYFLVNLGLIVISLTDEKNHNLKDILKHILVFMVIEAIQIIPYLAALAISGNFF